MTTRTAKHAHAPLHVLPPVRRLFGDEASSDALWAAWHALDDWEDTVEQAMGVHFGDVLVMLWLARLAGGLPTLAGAWDDFADDIANLLPGSLGSDVAGMAFALGAAWATVRERTDHRASS